MAVARVWAWIFLFDECGDIFYAAVRCDPVDIKIGKVCRAVGAFVAVGKANGAPKAFDIAEHFASQAPHACHPIAIQAPDAIGTYEPIKLLTRDAHPIGLFVTRKAHEARDDGVDREFADANEREDRNCPEGPPHAKVVAPPCCEAAFAIARENLRETAFDARALHHANVHEFMHAAPRPERNQVADASNDEPDGGAGQTRDRL